MSHTHVEKKEGKVKVEKDATTVKPHVPPENRAKDIQRHDKTNLVEVVEGLKHGELPSNAQIHKELGETREFVEHRQKHATTKDEQEAMKDMKDLLAVTQLTLEEKNRDNLLQHFLADMSALMEKPSLGLNDPKKLQKDVGTIMTSLKTIITALMKSPNFRNCVIDLIRIVREILSYNSRQTQAGSKLQSSFTTTGVSTKETAKQVATDAKDTMLNMRPADIPQKHRDAIMAHLQMLIREINQYPESREAFQKLINLWAMANEETYKHWDIASTDPDFKKVYDEGIKLIEAYTGGRSIHEFLLRFRKVVIVISQDPEIRDFFNDFRDYLTTAVSKPELIDNQAFTDRGYALIKRGRILAKRYREDVIINAWLDEGYEIALAMKNDTRVNQLLEHAKRVANDFTYTDKHGRRHFNTELLDVIRTEIIPFLISRIKEVPVPGFEVQNPDFEYLIVDDIFITIDDILPDMIKLHTESKTEVGLASDLNPLAHKTYAKFHIDGVRPSIKDFYFSFKRKKVITITDEGRADLRIVGSGVNITITFEVKTDRDSDRAVLAVADVDVLVDRIDLDILEAKHKVLLNLATSLFKSKLKVAVENAIKGKIQDYATDLVGTINKKVITNVSMSKIGDTVKSTIKEKVLA